IHVGHESGLLRWIEVEHCQVLRVVVGQEVRGCVELREPCSTVNGGVALESGQPRSQAVERWNLAHLDVIELGSELCRDDQICYFVGCFKRELDNSSAL